MTDLCKCDIKEKLRAMWERLQTTIYGIRLNGQRLVPDGQGIIDINIDDLFEIDDQVRNNTLPVQNKAIKDYVDTGDSANAADIDILETRLGDLETATGDAITSAEFTANASSVVSVHKHLDTAVDSDSIPVASITQAGVINASDYAAFLQMQGDIEDLKDITITYQVSLPSDSPSQAEISAAFSTAYPTVPLIAGLKVADYNRNLAYQYDGSIWVSQQFTGTIPVATSTVIGGVKSSNTDGEITVNIGGTMALNGYDSITDRLDDIDGTGGTVEQLESEVQALQDAIGDSATADTIIYRLNTAEDNIQMMDSDIEDLSQDVTVIDGQIDAINTAVSGLQTAVDGKVSSSNITHETWTFTLEDSTTVTKEVVLYVN